MTPWICFEWETKSLPGDDVSVAPLVIRRAAKDDEVAVGRVIASAIAMDSSWSDATKKVGEKLAGAVDEAFDEGEPDCIVLVHGSRIVGASVVDVSPDSENHLLTGPCVLHEYRNRGLGTGLLKASLEFLAQNGVTRARAITRANSVTARFVYPKFGGVPSPLQADPLVAKGE